MSSGHELEPQSFDPRSCVGVNGSGLEELF